MDRFRIRLLSPSSPITPSWVFYGREFSIGSDKKSDLYIDDDSMDSQELHIYVFGNEIMAKRTGSKGSLIIGGTHLDKGETTSVDSSFKMIKDKRVFEISYHNTDKNIAETMVVAKNQISSSTSIQISSNDNISRGDYLRGITIPIEGVLTIGRSDQCHITLPDPSISRHHAIINIDSQTPLVKDLNTKNGIFMDKKRIKGSMIWSKGISLTVGNYNLKLM
jgi:FHA domain